MKPKNPASQTAESNIEVEETKHYQLPSSSEILFPAALTPYKSTALITTLR